jgi:hypothetical protein
MPGRYLAMMEDGRHVVELVAASGTHFVNVFDKGDIFMPPVKRTIYVNIYPNTSPFCSASANWHETAEGAKDGVGPNAIAVAVPVEIEE